jgi:hypothetical protein
MRPRPSQTPFRRLTQALWAALYVLGLVCSSAHFGLVAHRVCEHGEVVHSDAHHGGAPHDEAHHASDSELSLESLAHASAGESREHAPVGESDGEEHEHCEVQPGTQLAPPFELARLSFAQFLEEFFGPRVVPTPCAPSIAILRLAPGHSPPRA